MCELQRKGEGRLYEGRSVPQRSRKKRGGNPEGRDQDQEAVTRFIVGCDVCEETPGAILTPVSFRVV